MAFTVPVLTITSFMTVPDWLAGLWVIVPVPVVMALVHVASVPGENNKAKAGLSPEQIVLVVVALLMAGAGSTLSLIHI